MQALASHQTLYYSYTIPQRTKENEMTKQLIKNWFGHKAGETVEVLKFMGSGRYRVRFEDGSTDIVGASSLSR